MLIIQVSSYCCSAVFALTRWVMPPDQHFIFSVLSSFTMAVTDYPSKQETLSQCCFNVGPRLRRWPNIKTTLAQRLVFPGIESWWIMSSLIGPRENFACIQLPFVMQFGRHCNSISDSYLRGGADPTPARLHRRRATTDAMLRGVIRFTVRRWVTVAGTQTKWQSIQCLLID